MRRLLSESPLAFAMPRTESAPGSIAIRKQLNFQNTRTTPRKSVSINGRSRGASTSTEEAKGGKRKHWEAENHGHHQHEVASRKNLKPTATLERREDVHIEEMLQSRHEVARIFASEIVSSALVRAVNVEEEKSSELMRTESKFE